MSTRSLPLEEHAPNPSLHFAPVMGPSVHTSVLACLRVKEATNKYIYLYIIDRVLLKEAWVCQHSFEEL